jgi:hypothetical protein
VYSLPIVAATFFAATFALAMLALTAFFARKQQHDKKKDSKIGQIWFAFCFLWS